jgi:hypothetical protein
MNVRIVHGAVDQALRSEEQDLQIGLLLVCQNQYGNSRGDESLQKPQLWDQMYSKGSVRSGCAMQQFLEEQLAEFHCVYVL